MPGALPGNRSQYSLILFTFYPTFMRCTSIVFPFLGLLATCLIAGCTKTQTPKVNNTNSPLPFPDPFSVIGLDIRLQTAIKHLKASPEKAAAFSKAVRKGGTPYWS